MITTSVPVSHADLLERPLIAHLATLRPDGAPQSNPMWFLWRDGRVFMTHTRARQKYRNLQTERRVALSICDDRDSTRYLELRGVVERMDDDPGARFYEQLKVHYAYKGPSTDVDVRIVIVIRPTRFQTRQSRSTAGDG
jgi:PPOX class probable F420-dependent enzyme